MSDGTGEAMGHPTIITGQQIGLLGGPLYTTYKVLGAIHQAQQLNGTAIYWLETNDADFNEINHIDYLDSNGQLKTLVWNIPSFGFSCGMLPVDNQLISLLLTFFSTIRQTPYTAQLEKLVLDCYTIGRTLAEASSKLASELFRGFSLHLFNPAQKEFREFSRNILLKEAQLTPEGQQCNLFCMMGNQRKAIFKKEHQFVLRDMTAINIEDYDLVPNVKTRNVCQDAFFNTHTYVAGPGEVKYIAELDPIYDIHGVKKAAVLRRMSVTLIEPRVARLLEKTGLTLNEIIGVPIEELLKHVLKEKSDIGLDFNQLLQSGMDITESYLSQLETLGVDVTEIKSLRKYLRPEIKKACGNLRAREKEKHQRLLADVRLLSDYLFPFGKRQERVFNIFYYMNLYGGVDFISFLYRHYQTQREILEIQFEQQE